MSIDHGICECCNKEPAIGVASLPAPMSIAWCRKCVEARVVPYWFAVYNTATCGGLANSADWWRETVARTLIYFDKGEAQFHIDVQHDIDELAKGPPC